MREAVTLSEETAEALSVLDIVGAVSQRNIDLHAMAWLVLVLKKLVDSDERFPRGKWATIQHIEGQLDEAARDRSAEIERWS